MSPTPGRWWMTGTPTSAQVLGVADARHLEQLWRVEGAAAQDDLVGRHRASSTAPGAVGDAGGPPTVEAHAQHGGPRHHLEVPAVHHRVQVGARRAEPAAAVEVLIEAGEALLAVAVDIVGQRVTRLLNSLEEGAEQRVRRRAAFEHDRSTVAAVLVATGQAVLHLLEVREAVGVVPVGHAWVGCPALVVERVAALEDHPVDARGAAEHLAPRVADATAAHERLWFALVLPVVEAVAARQHQGGGHVDQYVPPVVGPSGFEDEHAGGRVGAQPVGQHGARRAAADDHEVVRSGS